MRNPQREVGFWVLPSLFYTVNNMNKPKRELKFSSRNYQNLVSKLYTITYCGFNNYAVAQPAVPSKSDYSIYIYLIW